MQRRFAIEPDTVAQTEEGPQPAVSLQAVTNALCELAVLLHRSGGTGSVVTMRKRTLLPGEAVTTGAVVEWRDRTDAKPQPERITEATNGSPPDAPARAIESVEDTIVVVPEQPPKEPAMDQPLPPPPLPPQKNEVRIIEGAEAEAQHRYDSTAQRAGQDEELVDEADVPPRLRG
jgi:hypothetical protein